MKRFTISLFVQLSAFGLFAQVGSVDSSFGTNGFFVTPFEGGAWGDKCLQVLPDNKILIIGDESGFGTSDMALIRCNPDGSLDNTFGNNGKAVTNFSTNSYGQALTVQPDGKIVVIGSDQNNLFIGRYNQDGHPDYTFGNNGFTVINIPGTVREYRFVKSVALQSDGKIVVGGHFGDEQPKIFLTRCYADGILDLSFGNGGLVIADIRSGWDYLETIQIQPDGKIVVCGNSEGSSMIDEPYLTRFNEDGTLDTSFNHGDIIFKTVPGASITFCNSVNLQPDGKIVMAGSAQVSGAPRLIDMFLARFEQDGTPDLTFGDSGLAVNILGFLETSAHDIIFEEDGKILVAGASRELFTSDFLISRFKPNGKPDFSFGSYGSTIIGWEVDESAAALDFQGNKVIVAGYSAYGIMAVRYLLELSLEIDDFSLEKRQPLIYPNPVREVSTLKYALEEAAMVKKDLYDLNGRLVYALGKDFAEMGEHSEIINWPRELPDGMYILRIAASDKVASVQIMKH